MEVAKIDVDEKLASDAAYYAFKTLKFSLDKNMKPRFGDGGLLSHMLGKLGELVFYRYCLENKIAVKHTPFRDDYSKLNGNDDFIVSFLGHDFRVEVKTSVLKNAFNPDEKLRIFYNREQYKSQKDHNYIVVFIATNKEMNAFAILGWIHAEDIKSHPIWERGLESPAYAIPITALKSMKLFREDGVWK